MKLWHDDIREPPEEGWVWARTNDEAMLILTNCEVEEASLDHDLGLHELDPKEQARADLLRGTGEETGLDLARAMVSAGIVPDRVRVHSWSPPGAQAMAAELRKAGGTVVVEPFRSGERR